MRRLALFALLPLLAGAVPIMRPGGTGRLVSSDVRRSDVAARYVFIANEDGTWDRSASYRTGALTVTGPATTVDRGDGTAVTVPQNTLAVGPAGALVYGAHTQSTLHTNDPTQVEWIKEAGVTVEKNSKSCPIGPLGDRMHLVTAAADAGIYQSWTHSATAYTVSAWLARATADADCTASLGFAAQAGLGYTQPTLTATPTRISKTATSAATASGIHLLTRTGDTCARFCVWGANETNTSALFPYSATGAAPLSVAATAVSVPNALRGNKWCVRVDATPGSHWRSDASRYLVAIGTSGADRAYIRVDGNDKLHFTVVDETTTGRFIFTDAPADSTEHTITACADSGTLALWVDGEQQSVSSGGTGSGVITSMPTTAAIGSNRASDHWSGSIRSASFCNTSNPERCR
jgi:hypothetical protein